jgi:hypothetical protein
MHIPLGGVAKHLVCGLRIVARISGRPLVLARPVPGCVSSARTRPRPHTAPLALGRHRECNLTVSRGEQCPSAPKPREGLSRCRERPGIDRGLQLRTEIRTGRPQPAGEVPAARLARGNATPWGSSRAYLVAGRGQLPCRARRRSAARSGRPVQSSATGRPCGRHRPSWRCARSSHRGAASQAKPSRQG